MQQRKFKVLNSSAGSGKTYNLTKEYLKLALHTPDPAYYRTILAITFTKDAAREMKERILSSLRSFSRLETLPEKEREKAWVFLDEITRELQQDYDLSELTPYHVRERAQLVFRHILYHYTDFAVSTIDSFVNRVVSAFTQELKIPFNFQVDLDSRTLLASAVDVLLSRAGSAADPLLSELLEQYALEKADQGRNWNNLPNELISFAQNLLNEQVYDAVSSIRHLHLDDFKNIREQLVNYQRELHAQVKGIAQQAMSLIDSEGLTEKAFYYGSKGIYGFFTRLAASSDLSGWKSPLENSFIAKTLEEDVWYSSSTPAPFKAGVDQIKSQLRDLVVELEKLREERHPTHRLISVVLPQLYKLSLLNEIKHHLDVIQYDTSKLHISEFNKRIVDIVLTEPVPFIYERLGTRYNHLLIDEFQDTSTLQWNNLLPLVDNSLGSAHFNMVVGDAKQAIYRWRGGEMEQIIHLYQGNTRQLTEGKIHEDLLEERYQSVNAHLFPSDLVTNYRSAREIIEFNNSLFAHLSMQKSENSLLQNIYAEGFQQKPPAERIRTGGHVEILFTKEGASDESIQQNPDAAALQPPTELNDSYVANTLRLTLGLVEEALQAGYHWRDIAVLHRTNRNARQTANFLKEKGIAIISQDSLSLQFSEIVNFVLAIFKVYIRPDDTLAKSEALYLYYLVVHNRVPDTEQSLAISQIARGWSGNSNTALNRQDAIDNFYHFFLKEGFSVPRFETVQLSIYQTTEQLVHVFGLFSKGRDTDYLFRFLDVVLEYSFNGSNNLADFLEYWELHKETISINTPQDRDAVTVTTIHKSKGLAYPVVIVPFADWSMEPRHDSLLWSKLQPGALPVNLGPNLTHGLQAVATATTSALAETPLSEAYHTEVEKTFVENFNMLYVALTRPEDRLYLIGHEKDFDKNATYRKNVSYLLYQYLVMMDQWSPGQMRYQIALGREASSHRKQVTAPVFVVNNPASYDWTDQVQLKRSAASVFDLETLDPELEEQNKIVYALCKIRYADELDQAIQQLLNEGIVSRKEVKQLRTDIISFLENEEIKPYFSRNYKLETGKEVVDEAGRILRPSRVVSKNGVLTGIEFKCGDHDPHTMEELQTYAALLEDFGHKVGERLVIYTAPLRVIRG